MFPSPRQVLLGLLNGPRPCKPTRTHALSLWPLSLAPLYAPCRLSVLPGIWPLSYVFIYAGYHLAVANPTRLFQSCCFPGVEPKELRFPHLQNKWSLFGIQPQCSRPIHQGCQNFVLRRCVVVFRQFPISYGADHTTFQPPSNSKLI